ncbi:DUF1016 domain-containing protein [Sphingobacterium sp. JUb56]|uniref:DUF1016 domain-containing protein n=1 Tax=Sphingobacterium sp. JUb56 TaxID=2587145 RepID=UPI0021A3FE80
MLELGNGFSFVSRQKRIHLVGDEFFVDLDFYNVILFFAFYENFINIFHVDFKGQFIISVLKNISR